MNCLRSLNFIKKIDTKYKKYGLETILIHPPEWEFEKNKKNVSFAVKKYIIKFPIIIDKDKKIIKKLKINFWPSQILIKDGKILYKHIGEGNYKVLEENIIKFLKTENNISIKNFNRRLKFCNYTNFPTIYCGKRKNDGISNLKPKLKFGTVYKSGKWIQKNEYIKSIGKENSLTLLTNGKIINFVAESLTKNPIRVTIKINDKFMKDITVKKPQLYKIVKLKNSGQKKLTLIAKNGLKIYSFSFE